MLTRQASLILSHSQRSPVLNVRYEDVSAAVGDMMTLVQAHKMTLVKFSAKKV
jgi:hypothetical protein